MLEIVLKTCTRHLYLEGKNRVGPNETTLACEDALLFKGGIKLTTKQVGDVRYVEDKNGNRFQLKEMAALAPDQRKGSRSRTSKWSTRLG